MANRLQLRRNTTPGTAPTAGQLLTGELVANLADLILYSKDGSGNVVKLFPALTGDVTTTAGSLTTSIGVGKVTNSMLAGSIANSKLANSTISGVSLGSNLNDLTVSTGLRLNSGTTFNGSAAKTLSLDSTATPSFRGIRNQDYDTYFRGGTDINHGVGWYGTGKLWNSANIDGPVLYGYSGGALGTYASGPIQRIALYWNSSGKIGIGTTSPGSLLDISGGDINLADTVGAVPYVIKSYSNATSFWLYPSNGVTPRLMLSDSLSWDRGVAFDYNPGTTGAASGLLTIGQILKNNANYTHGVTAFYTNGLERVRINSSGNVGIGTTSPSAPLEVSGNASKSASYGYLNSSGSIGTSSGTNSYSIWASDRIKAIEFNAVSDRRIKKNVRLSSDAISVINQIQPVQFEYVDTITKGTATKHGLIAQDVEKVVPNAVTKIQDFIPNVFELTDQIEFEDGNLIITTEKLHQLSVGDVVKLITNGGVKERGVVEVTDFSFSVRNSELSFLHDVVLSETSGINEKMSIFVYGKKVNDFRVLDYDAIFTIGIRAIQELDQKIEILRSELCH